MPVGVLTGLQLVDKVLAPRLMSCGVDFLRRCTQVQGRGPCPQGTTTTRFKQVCVALVSFLSVEPMWSARDAEDAGTAKRRRERRLRQFLGHERLTVAMLLAQTETQHHAAPRGQNMARSRGEESELNKATGQKTPHSQGGKHNVLQLGRRRRCACRPA